MSLFSKLQPALLPLSWLYALGARLDVQRRMRRRHRSSLPVISVGNLGVGGSGKTPLVQLLAERLQKDSPVLILSRGYGRSGVEEVVWNAGDPLPDPGVVGDEPALLVRSIHRGAVAVGTDRARLLSRIEPEYPGAIVILDDGFQHHQLARDVDIVILDGPTAAAPHRLIPAGRLRERPSALRRADLVVTTALAARALAARHLPPERIFDAAVSARGVRSMSSGTLLAYGARVVLVTGIARSERARQTVSELGLVVEQHLDFADHHPYPQASVTTIERTLEAHPGAHLVTTLKDAVKLERHAGLAARLHVVEVALRLGEEERFLRAVRERLRAPARGA